MISETSEDILAKYRRKPSNNSDITTSDSASSSSKLKSNSENATVGTSGISSGPDERWTIDHSNVENTFAFTDAKRKLRIVLSTASEHSSSWDMNVGERMVTQILDPRHTSHINFFIRF